MKHLIFILEEPSAKELLKQLLPRINNNITFQFIVFEGKSDLENNIEKKLKGFNIPNTQFVIIRDQDSEDCIIVKQRLLQKCINSNQANALIRIACRELESWYFGDLNAVSKALKIPSLSKYQNKRKYRVPDNIIKPSLELAKITKEKYQKISGSREIGNLLSLDNNNSYSFNIFIKSIKTICNN